MSLALRQRVVQEFATAFGAKPTHLFSAPGRVNLIGEHTDYEDGFVLPCAIDRATLVAARATNDARLRVVAADEQDSDDFDLDRPIRPSEQKWANYVRGVAAMLVADGHRLSGARLAIAGDVPLGSGLSSSASLEIAVALAMESLSALDIEPTELARIGQRAENDFAGCECGIMDQLVVLCGRAGHALLIDCRSLVHRPVTLPAEAAIVIVHSGARHENSASGYNERRRQCRAAAEHYGMAALRDLDEASLVEKAAGLDPILFRRARHVVSENARVLAAADALAAGDLEALGRLMIASHVSMRDDFEITTPEIDVLAEIMNAALGGIGGARMTGGGFGGCVVAMTHASLAERLSEKVRREYRTPGGAAPDLFRITAADGAHELRL
jgi:galactokinase